MTAVVGSEELPGARHVERLAPGMVGFAVELVGVEAVARPLLAGRDVPVYPHVDGAQLDDRGGQPRQRGNDRGRAGVVVAQQPSCASRCAASIPSRTPLLGAIGGR